MGLNRAREPWRPGPVFDYAFELARVDTVPRLCVVTTAGGDQAHIIENFSAAFTGRSVELSHLTLFDRPNVPEVALHLRGQDVIWVDRGSLVNALAVWRAHGLDTVLAECWQAGVVLAGESAGSLCWHRGGVTDSFGEIRAVPDGLGFLPFSNCVHYSARRELFQHAVATQKLPGGYATDAGAGLHFENAELIAAISDRKNAGAYRVERGSDESVVEYELDVQWLKRS